MNYRSAKAMRPPLDYLAVRGVVMPDDAAGGSVEALFACYCRHLVGERGLAPGTARCYLDVVRPFVASRLGGGQGGELDLAGLTAAEVSGFVLATCPGRANGTAKLIVTSLRSLLRFLHVEGLIPDPLVAAVPSVGSRRLAGLAQGLKPAQVRRLLASCDRRRARSRRDYAIVVLLSRLGLRAGDVAALALDDIDWRAGQILVHGKGHRAECLPLPDDVGTAIAAGVSMTCLPRPKRRSRTILRIAGRN